MSTDLKRQPMGRREARRIDRREAILAVAAASFLDRGYSATSMSAIASTIGGSKATLWSYFPSKEALFAAVLDHLIAAYRAQLSSLLEADGDFEAILLRFCTSFVETLASPRAIALHRLVHAEAGRLPEVGRIFFERAPKTTFTLLADFIASAMERGLLRRDDPLLAAKALGGLCGLGTHQQLLLGLIEAPTPEDMEADVQAAMDIFLRAYRP